jgi:hypothetical protein
MLKPYVIAAFLNVYAAIQHAALDKVKAPLGLPLPKLGPSYLSTVR